VKDVRLRIAPVPKSDRVSGCAPVFQRVKIGGAEGIRTLDLLDAIEARSQLRHGPTAWKETLRLL
jgi:hypothetical protein